ncbi:unnamed protein product [Penicillium viridicatum]
MLDLTVLKSRHEAIRLNEDSKDEIIEDLISHVQRLDEALQCERNESQDQKKLVGIYRKDAETFQAKLAQKSRKEATLKFVTVLVDGDHMNFRDEFVQNEKNGGRLAARALIEAVQDHIRKIKPDTSPNIKYKIGVYANVAGLGNTYCDTSAVSSQDDLNSFIQGFNMEDTLCDFVDAGSGKECSDVKIRALFEHYFLDVHCEHIIFCGSADNGYARVLGSHRGSDRISLVEGPPFARLPVEEDVQECIIWRHNDYCNPHAAADAHSKLCNCSEKKFSNIKRYLSGSRFTHKNNHNQHSKVGSLQEREP